MAWSDVFFWVLNWLGANFLAVALLLFLATPMLSIGALIFSLFVLWKLAGKKR